MNGSEELRKASRALQFIGSLLDSDEGWKVVMSYIPKDLGTDIYIRSDHYERKYNDEHIRLIKDHAEKERRSYTNVLFEEWGSSGRIRPTLHTLMAVLTKAQMFRAADHLADVLRVSHPPRPADGPGAAIDVTGYLQNITTTEISPETRMLPNGVTNGSDDAVCHRATRPLEGSVNLIQFPTTRTIGETIPIPVLDEQRTAEMPNNRQNFNERSDMIRWTDRSLPSENYLPRFDLINDQSNNSVNNNNMSMTSGQSVTSGHHSVTSSFSSHNNNELSQILNHLDIQSVNEPLKWVIDHVHTDVTQDTCLTNFKYSDLVAITDNFKYMVGSGGFGNVFKGNHKEHGMLAIKKSHDPSPSMSEDLIMKIFNTEIISLAALRHQNIVHILGYSIDGGAPCIVCEYIEGGSLQEYLMVQEKKRNLNTSRRMNIMIGTANGLKHMHSTEKPSTITGTHSLNFVHGDVKSANILITRDFVPKICDLGLTKQCTATHHTQSIMGTTGYMSHERVLGTITPKGDTYSYGIVLLELLTGLPPTENETKEGKFDIKTYVEEICEDGNIGILLDKDVGEWPEAQKIYQLSVSCTEHERVKRPTFGKICDILKDIVKTS